jgi:hypothetical protein
LVQACAEYANSIGVPLPEEDTDEQIWRERVQIALERTPPSAPVDAAASAPALVDLTVSRPPRWNLDPLVRAGMYDMVDLIRTSEHLPMAQWLPTLTNSLDAAGMSYEQFLKGASIEQARDLTEIIMSMISRSRDKAIDRLMYLCAKNQPAESIPVIIVLLRRWKDGEGVEVADQIIGLISGDRHGLLVRNDCVDVVLALRSATMERDAIRLLKGVGKHAQPDYLFQVAASFPDSTLGDRETVLGAVAEGSFYHLRSALKELPNITLYGMDPMRTLDRIIFGIPSGKHETFASTLESEGMYEEALRIRELKDEPPF